MGTGAAAVRIVIVNFEGGRLLDDTLAALALQTFRDFEVVVVDNCSTRHPVAKTTLPDTRFRVLALGANCGFSAGSNIGAAGSDAEWLVMLNPDTAPEPGWLAAMMAAARAHPGIDVFGATLVCADDPGVADGIGDNYGLFGLAWRGGSGRPLPARLDDALCFSPCGAAAMYRTRLFHEMGGFADGHFCILEDVDLGFRLQLAGHDCLQVADARVRHVGSAIMGRLSPFSAYHTARNGIWTLYRCMPGPLLPLAGMLQAACYLLLWPRMARAGAGGAWARGMRDGLLGLPDQRAARAAIQRRRRIGLGALLERIAINPLALANRRVLSRPVGERAGAQR